MSTPAHDKIAAPGSILTVRLAFAAFIWIGVAVAAVATVLTAIPRFRTDHAAAEQFRAQVEASRAQQQAVGEPDLARSACQEFVTRWLHEPESAQFDDYRGFLVVQPSPGAFQVLATLRAKNGFGAMRHITVSCKLRHSGDTWSADSVTELG